MHTATPHHASILFIPTSIPMPISHIPHAYTHLTTPLNPFISLNLHISLTTFLSLHHTTYPFLFQTPFTLAWLGMAMLTSISLAHAYHLPLKPLFHLPPRLIPPLPHPAPQTSSLLTLPDPFLSLSHHPSIPVHHPPNICFPYPLLPTHIPYQIHRLPISHSCLQSQSCCGPRISAHAFPTRWRARFLF